MHAITPIMHAKTLGCDIKLTNAQAVALWRAFEELEERNSQLRVELEQVKRVANDQAQLAAQLKSVVLQLHLALYDSCLSGADTSVAMSAVFDSYPMLAEWLKDGSHAPD